MPTFEIRCATTGHEVYLISAEDEGRARVKLETSAPEPLASEVLSMEVTSVKEVEDD